MSFVLDDLKRELLWLYKELLNENESVSRLQQVFTTEKHKEKQNIQMLTARCKHHPPEVHRIFSLCEWIKLRRSVGVSGQLNLNILKPLHLK